MSSHPVSPSIAVIKMGGSILTAPISYARAAQYLSQRLAALPEERFVAVVSAQNGATDALLQQAQAIAAHPQPAALDLLWSTGELRSAALLALHLQALGISAEALNIHETGLRLPSPPGGRTSVAVDPELILQALARCAVAIVPGFLATDRAGKIVSLGRGGSDLTAVLLAAALEACRCELIKDVPGYFSDDPHRHRGASPLSQLTFAEAIAMARAGCDLVQCEALEAAQKFDLPLLVRSLDENGPISRVADQARAAHQPMAQAAM